MIRDRTAEGFKRVFASNPVSRSQLLFGAIVSVLISLALIGASRTGWLWEAPDRFTYDWRTYLLTERLREPHKDIVIITVTEESLTGYPYLSPVDRALTAELIGLVGAAGAAAIGWDFIIDRATEAVKHDALVKALQATTNAKIFLAALDERASDFGPRSMAFQENFIAETGRPAGHIFFSTEPNRLMLGDQAVRFIAPPSPLPPSRPSFAQLLAGHDRDVAAPASPYIFWRLPPSGEEYAFRTYPVTAHRDENGARAGALLPESVLSQLKDKIVLIGGAFADRDRHLTPLSIAASPFMHGVEIHAHIVAQLRDGRSIFVLSWYWEALLVAVVTALGFLAGRIWNLSGEGWRVFGVAVAVMIFAGLFLYWAFYFVMPSATIFFGWTAGLLLGRSAEWVMRCSGWVFRRKAAALGE